MFCPKCGTENTDSTKFCVKCGTKMVTDEPTPAQAPSPPAPAPAAAGPPPVPSVGRPPIRRANSGNRADRIILLVLSIGVSVWLLIAVVTGIIGHRHPTPPGANGKQSACPQELLTKYKTIMGGSGSAKQIVDKVQLAIQTDIGAEIDKTKAAGQTYANNPWGVEASRLEACAMAATEMGKDELSGEFDRRATAKFSEMASHGG